MWEKWKKGKNKVKENEVLQTRLPQVHTAGDG